MPMFPAYIQMNEQFVECPTKLSIDILVGSACGLGRPSP